MKITKDKLKEMIKEEIGYMMEDDLEGPPMGKKYPGGLKPSGMTSDLPLTQYDVGELPEPGGKESEIAVGGISALVDDVMANMKKHARRVGLPNVVINRALAELRPLIEASVRAIYKDKPAVMGIPSR
jgi:hypothetical protein